MSKTILTKVGYEKLKEELTRLKTKDRPTVIERIKNAREIGDLSENADYSDAREQQAFIEGRIEELEDKLRYAKIINERKSSSNVSIGNTVYLSYAGKKETYQIVGDDESDPTSGKISAASPIAKALLGKKAGDSVEIKIPLGTKKCKITKIA